MRSKRSILKLASCTDSIAINCIVDCFAFFNFYNYVRI